MSDDEKTESESEATGPEVTAETAPTEKARRHSRRGRLISGGIVLVGVAAIVLAVVQAQADGYHTPTNEGYVPFPDSSTSAPSSTAPQSSPIAAPIKPTKTKKPKPAATKTKKPTPSKSKTPPRPVMPAPEMQLQISSIGVDAPVVPASVGGGTLSIPADPKYVGLWTGGARPGWSKGSIVVAGHVDSLEWGKGAFFTLDHVAMGSIVTFHNTGSGNFSYRIVGRRVYTKSALPSEIFSTTGKVRLVLITCGGVFDSWRHSYESNIVLYGVPV